MKHLIILSMIAMSSAALAAPSTQILFQQKNHLGFSKTDDLVIDGKKSFVNALSLSKVPAVKLNPLIAKLTSIQPAKSTDCGSGEFEAKIKHKGKTQEFKGCMSGETYETLVSTFEELKTLARGAK